MVARWCGGDCRAGAVVVMEGDGGGGEAGVVFAVLVMGKAQRVLVGGDGGEAVLAGVLQVVKASSSYCGGNEVLAVQVSACVPSLSSQHRTPPHPAAP